MGSSGWRRSPRLLAGWPLTEAASSGDASQTNIAGVAVYALSVSPSYCLTRAYRCWAIIRTAGGLGLSVAGGRSPLYCRGCPLDIALTRWSPITSTCGKSGRSGRTHLTVFHRTRRDDEGSLRLPWRRGAAFQALPKGWVFKCPVIELFLVTRMFVQLHGFPCAIDDQRLRRWGLPFLCKDCIWRVTTWGGEIGNDSILRPNTNCEDVRHAEWKNLSPLSANKDHLALLSLLITGQRWCVTWISYTIAR